MRPIMIATAAVAAFMAASSAGSAQNSFFNKRFCASTGGNEAAQPIAASIRWSSAGHGYMEASTAPKISSGSRT